MNGTARRTAAQWIGTVAVHRVAAWVVVAAALILPTAGHAQQTVLADELLIGFRAEVTRQTSHAVARRAGVEFIEDIGRETRLIRVRVAPSARAAAAHRLERQPQVAFVETNAIHSPALIPDDPQYASQWHLPQIRVPQAWELTEGSRDAVLAILDSGVDPFHPELRDQLVAGTNTYDGSGVTADQNGHGTKMAGVAAARSNNGLGIAGVAGRSTIMPVRVTDRKGHATSASIAKGILWAADHGARVVNLSLEGVAGSPAILVAAEYAFRHGALVIAPSGNCGCTVSAAETPFILSVAATDASDQVAGFSTAGSFVDLAAPGVGVATTAMFGQYAVDSGTSVASAVVAGVASLMFAANPALTPDVATRILQETAFDPQRRGRDPHLGHGRVDAFAAVSAAATWRAPTQAEPRVHDNAALRTNAAATAARAP